MNKAFFITGTDTGVGKTWITLGLITALQRCGLSCNGMKPVASGCDYVDGAWRNDDAWRIQQRSDAQPAYASVNPYAFEPAIAPHIAAEQARRRIDFKRIGQAYRHLCAQVDVTVVEGVGGWRAPLNGVDGVAELAAYLGAPVILVVGMRLGCLNHALLTCESMRQRQVVVAGWVANQIVDPMPHLQENQRTLQAQIDAPCLGGVPHLKQYDPEVIANYLQVGPLLAAQ